MSRYFIDTYDGERHLRDEDGSEFLGTRDACDAAIRLLPDVARHVLRGDGGQHLIATVRDEHDRPIFKATLSLTTEWLISLPDPGHDPEDPLHAGDGEDSASLTRQPRGEAEST